MSHFDEKYFLYDYYGVQVRASLQNNDVHKPNLRLIPAGKFVSVLLSSKKKLTEFVNLALKEMISLENIVVKFVFKLFFH